MILGLLAACCSRLQGADASVPTVAAEGPTQLPPVVVRGARELGFFLTIEGKRAPKGRPARVIHELVISAVEPGGAAARAGVVNGEKIVAIGGVVVEELPVDQITARLAGFYADVTQPLLIRAKDSDKVRPVVLRSRAGPAPAK
jgi:predicted metalloprotease with PDZ domain